MLDMPSTVFAVIIRKPIYCRNSGPPHAAMFISDRTARSSSRF